MNHLVEILTLKLIFQIIQEKHIIKNISHNDTSSFALKTNIANLKTEIDKLDIDKLVPVPADLSKLSDVVKTDVVKKDVHNKLVAKIDNINTSGFVLKTKFDTDKSKLENKIPDTSGLVKNTDYDSKIIDTDDKIISGLATETVSTKVENKITLIIWLKIQIITLKLQKLKINLIIIIMINILLL